MEGIFFNPRGVMDFIEAEELVNMGQEVERVHCLLEKKKGLGCEFTGWLNLPGEMLNLVPEIKLAADKIRASSQVLVLIGIGGSYLGAMAAIEAFGSNFCQGNELRVFYAGHNLSSTYHGDLLKVLKGVDFSINVVSKSGTTMEPAIAFRILKNLLEAKYGQEGARERIFVTTGNAGRLRILARKEGYTTFDVPEDVGGRYSVLSPVGLLPMAAAGIDIQAMLEGARQGQADFGRPEILENPCYLYAAIRSLLYRQGKAIELLVCYEPELRYFSEWWKQLFGESEGKEGKGLFPAAATFTTDLHSLGQYIQEGRKLLFETAVRVGKSSGALTIPPQDDDWDGLNYLAGKDMSFVNDCAFRGTVEAHTVAGGVPNLVITLPELSEWYLGYLFYFMMKACAISGYLLGVNPFNQPGVEAYKENMITLLGKNP